MPCPQRAVGATAMNEHSSRSHLVFMLAINATNATTGQTAKGEAREDEAGLRFLCMHAWVWHI